MVQVAVPWALIERLSTRYLWSDGDANTSNTSDTWKKFVWHDRRGPSLPKELTPIEEKDVLRGQILSGKHVKPERMESFQEIKDRHALKVPIDGEEKRAMQGGFQTRRAREVFEKHCRGKIWIYHLGALTAGTR
ncbi:MAG: hypothetical protein M1826_001024 [Phylliscum demangeonii]|nr:MAG: hypothetical protein M1826_001024 [Phylliscum demangeonii]